MHTFVEQLVAYLGNAVGGNGPSCEFLAESLGTGNKSMTTPFRERLDACTMNWHIIVQLVSVVDVWLCMHY